MVCCWCLGGFELVVDRNSGIVVGVLIISSKVVRVDSVNCRSWVSMGLVYVVWVFGVCGVYVYED